MDEELFENVFARRSAMSFLFVALTWFLDTSANISYYGDCLRNRRIDGPDI